jgi:FlaA1/EpsC-like NDP-sugar epimerase
MIFLRKNPRRLTLYFLDILLSVASIYFAFMLRWDGTIPWDQNETFINLIPFVVFCRTISYFYFGFYSRFWEYSTLDDLLQIIKGVFSGTFFILFLTFIYNRSWMVPRSIIILDIIILVLLLGGSRVLWRIRRERVQQFSLAEIEDRTKILIFGAGDTGAHLLKYLKTSFLNYSILGFVDDNPELFKVQLMGVQVLGARDNIPELVDKLGAQELLISSRNISSKSLMELVEICARAGIKHKIVSSVIDLATKEIHISKIKNIEITDLLERDLISLDLSSINNMVKGKRVFVSGAGGSIGSQLCKFILEHNPANLVMMDIGENYLYDLKMDIDNKAGSTKTHYIFGSVTNSIKMDAVFSKFQPHLVFHAAAHKHVPLMEENIDAAITNNIYGTKLTADLSDKYGIEKFVLVSTDKVVRPTSIMGMTKRLSENYIQLMSSQSKTRFMIVRFGNVLGSNGSVVPLFEKQISSGGPITITHPDMERFFMVIPEAVQLILQAAAIGSGGEIFLLKMGDPVKIIDLANKMIELSGYKPGRDIDIKFTGIRPGEKMTEELVDEEETIIATNHEKINLLRPTISPNAGFGEKIESLCKDACLSDQADLSKTMKELIFKNPTNIILKNKTIF